MFWDRSSWKVGVGDEGQDERDALLLPRQDVLHGAPEVAHSLSRNELCNIDEDTDDPI